jgi:hypothetical protein
MATPTSLPAAFTVGQVATAAQMNDLRGAFRVLQLFSVQGNTVQTTTSATYGDITGLSITITPQATTSKILLMSSNALLASGAGADTGIRFLRGATAVYTVVQGVFAANTGASVSTIYLDSPATTSATTYKVQVNRFAGTGTVYSNVNSSFFSSFLVAEISA